MSVRLRRLAGSLPVYLLAAGSEPTTQAPQASQDAMWSTLNKIMWGLLAGWFGYAFGAEAGDHSWLGQTAFSVRRNTPVTHSMLWMTVLRVIIVAACWTHFKAQRGDWDRERTERSRRYTEWRQAWDARLETSDAWERAGKPWDVRLETSDAWEGVEG